MMAPTGEGNIPGPAAGPAERAAWVENAVADTRFGPVRWVAETGSTNTDAVEAALGGAGDGLVVVADHQTAGRGRLDRRWEDAPRHSLLATIVLESPLPTELSWWTVAVVAVSATEACRTLTDVPVRVKWPNDLVVPTESGDRKLAGILAQRPIPDGSLVAVGIGINLTVPPDVLTRANPDAISLADVGPAPPAALLLAEILRRVDRWCTLLATDIVRLQREYCRYSATIGHLVRVERQKGEAVTGTARGIDGTGCLLITGADGTDVAVDAGDVSRLG